MTMLSTQCPHLESNWLYLSKRTQCCMVHWPPVAVYCWYQMVVACCSLGGDKPYTFHLNLHGFTPVTQGSSVMMQCSCLATRCGHGERSKNCQNRVLFLHHWPQSTASTMRPSEINFIIVNFNVFILQINAVGTSPTFTSHQSVVFCPWITWNVYKRGSHPWFLAQEEEVWDGIIYIYIYILCILYREKAIYIHIYI